MTLPPGCSLGYHPVPALPGITAREPLSWNQFHRPELGLCAQRGSNASLRGRVQAVKLIRHTALRHLRAVAPARWSPIERTRFKVVAGKLRPALLLKVASVTIFWNVRSL